MSFYVVQFLTGLSSASALFLVASGLSIIFGVTRVVNFSHGSFYMLGAYLAWTLIEVMGGGVVGFWLAVLLAALIVGLIGALVEMSILRRVYQAPELFQLVTTFGVILVIQDVALLLWGPEDRVGQRAPGLAYSIDIGGVPMPVYDLALILLSPVVMLFLWLLFNRTRWGVLVRAATEDRSMVSALGVDERWLFTGTFFLGSVLAGLGGAAQLPKGGADLLMDFGILASIFAVVVVGGMGSIIGAFLAAVLISELNVFGILLLPQSTLVTTFVAMAVVLIFRPWGLLGREETVGQHGESGPLEPPLRRATAPLKLLGGVVLAGLIALPLWAEDFTLSLAIEMMLMALFAAALHFAMGPGGIVSFGHAAFFGGGAYAAALLVNYLNVSMGIGLLAAPIAAGALALLFGWFCVRLSGVYLAMLTLAFAQVAWSVVFQWGELTGGDDGMIGIWPADWASATRNYYYLCLLLVTLSLLFIRHAVLSPFGYALRACRDSPLRSAAIGILVQRQQWLGFALSGALAGVAGGLYVYSKGSIFPDEMSIPRSFDALIMVLMGGVQTMAGPVVGGAFFTWLQDQISRLDYWRLVLGLFILALVLLFPQGIVGWLRQRFGHRFGAGYEVES